MDQTAKDLIYLLRCAVRDVPAKKEKIEKMDLDAVYALAGRHMLQSAAAFALEAAGFKDERSQKAIAAAVRKTMIFDQEWSKIRKCMEEEGIWYVPLKGAVLKSMYPRYGMREFADFDILIDVSRAADVRDIMERLGYTTEYFGTRNHDIYHKVPVLNFEMHTLLFDRLREPELYGYYKDIPDRLVNGEGSGRSFSPEDFYLYLLAHEYKHYKGPGTGLRAVFDIYIYFKHTELDMEYVASEAEKIGIAEFERANRELVEHLFETKKLTEQDVEMLEYMVSSNTYGNLNNRVLYKMKSNGWGKIQYMLSRFIGPVSKKDRLYELYAHTYPVFYKHRVLLIFLPFYRIVQGIKKGKLQAEVKIVLKTKSSKKG